VLKDEIVSYKKQHEYYPKGFLLGAFQAMLPDAFQQFFPHRLRPHLEHPQEWLNHSEVQHYEWKAKSLQENLINQVKLSPLPSLLRYEDRNSMAFSVESRTPFMDYRLMEFTLGLPEEFVYRQGDRKFILRNAFRGIVSDQILDRKDKMGFVSEEERWIKEEGKGWFFDQVMKPLPHPYDKLFNSEGLNNLIQGIQSGNREFSYEPWRILNFKIWLKKMLENYN
jgi:asparagine synthase (glutamine-hydrolysing)